MYTTTFIVGAYYLFFFGYFVININLSFLPRAIVFGLKKKNIILYVEYIFFNPLREGVCSETTYVLM